MFVILVYDVGVKRNAKVLKLCRRYLTWVQNSVFEGELTEGKYKALKHELTHVIDDEDDSVLIYLLRTTRYSKRESLGTPKGGDSMELIL